MTLGLTIVVLVGPGVRRHPYPGAAQPAADRHRHAAAGHERRREWYTGE